MDTGVYVYVELKGLGFGVFEGSGILYVVLGGIVMGDGVWYVFWIVGYSCLYLR